MMETYVKIPDRIMNRKKLSPAAKLLYGLLMSLCQSRGYCWATNGALADRMGMSTRSITRLLGELREHGLVYDDRSNPETMEMRSMRILRLTEPEEIVPDERRDISGEGDVDSSRDFGGWLNQCIARMEQAKQQWAQSRPQQPEHGSSAGVGQEMQEMQVTATPQTAGDAGFGAREVRAAVVEKVPGNAGFHGQERQEMRPTALQNAPGYSGFAVPERRDTQPSYQSRTPGNTGFGVSERQEEQSAVPAKAPAHAGFVAPERREVRPDAPVKAPGGTGFAVQERREVQPSAPVKASAHTGFAVPERREVQASSQPRTSGHAGFVTAEQQGNRAVVMPEMPGYSGSRGQERREVRPSAPAKVPGGAGFAVPERQEARPATPAKAPAHAGFTAPERQETPKPAQPLPSTQALPSQTDPVLEGWIQIRHRDWSQEDRAQFSGFWQTYWQERQQQGNPFPEKPIRHRFLERVNLLSGGDRATMQDILRHHRISQ